MNVLLFLYASAALAWSGVRLDTKAKGCYYWGSWWWMCSWLERGESTCTIYAKNNGVTESTIGKAGWAGWVDIDFEDGTPDLTKDTWVWTSCDDALTIDQVKLYARGHMKSWGQDNGQVWCMSTNWYDMELLNQEAYNGKKQCFKTLVFKTDGKAYFYSDNSWSPDGRRALAAESVPTLKDVQECEKDKNTPQEVCNGLVDMIFTYDAKHMENVVEIVQDETNDDDGLAMVTSSPAISTGVDWALYGFAAFGLAFVVLQGAKFVKQNQKEVFTPIKAQDEL